MRRIELEELRHLELEILDYVATFCDEHEITYWLDFGTLIGAIRHKGYIPWDDDIDISMMRADYERFMKLFNDEQTSESKYEMYCIENDHQYGLLFGKVQNNETIIYEHRKIKNEHDTSELMKKKHRGVKIDIFIYDNVPDDKNEAERIFRKRDFYRKITELRRKTRKPKGNLFRIVCSYMLRCLCRIMFSPLPVNYFLVKATKLFSKNESVPVKCVSCFTSWYSAAIDKHVFDSFIDVEFEGRKYKAPIGYDELLRAYYGDYMQLPPVEERKLKHEIIAYVHED